MVGKEAVGVHARHHRGENSLVLYYDRKIRVSTCLGLTRTNAGRQHDTLIWLGWVGLGWVGLGWVGLGWVGLACGIAGEWGDVSVGGRVGGLGRVGSASDTTTVPALAVDVWAPVGVRLHFLRLPS